MLLQLLLAMLWGGSRALDTRYRLQVQREVRVQEGLCVLVPCSFSYPRDGWDDSTPALGYWYKDRRVSMASDYVVAVNNQKKWVHRSTQDRFQLVGDPQSMSCSLLIKEAKQEDSGQYYFRVERGSQVKFNYRNFEFSLEVTAQPQEPDVYIPETLEPGRQATAICVTRGSFEGCPTPTVSWRETALSSLEPGTPHFSVLTLTPSPQDHGSSLTCRVEFSRRGESAERTVQLSVAHAPRNLEISISLNSAAVEPQTRGSELSHLDARQGQALRLLCEAESLPPAILSWTLGGRVLSWSQPWGPRGLALELPSLKAGDSGTYTCTAEHRLGSLSRTLELSVQYPANWEVGPSAPNPGPWTLPARKRFGAATDVCPVTAPSPAEQEPGTISDAPKSLTVDVSQGNNTGSPEPLAELVLVAIWEAAIKSLLLLLCLVILLLQTHRKEGGQAPQGARKMQHHQVLTSQPPGSRRYQDAGQASLD
ncbi:sialic acid-binding Ig-like lectin 10 [Erinaceus europaeus]|uniref:Sialic acid-binding Ig-like lectin 10 n=1 Tax=Erinaceus europaeus TaxID=9365 RepID=A0ABM3X111_ERIEU|nr:sialic acid-binding Ig-like lectin 10 [Erinaceus europaeus]